LAGATVLHDPHPSVLSARANRCAIIRLARRAPGTAQRGFVRFVRQRPETIEETAELVTAAGGVGIAVALDHLEAGSVEALVQRIDAECGQAPDHEPLRAAAADPRARRPRRRDDRTDAPPWR